MEIRMLNRVGRIWNPSVGNHQHHRTCDGRRRRPVRSGLCRRRRDRRPRPRPGRDELDYAAAAGGSWICAGDASAADGAGARPRRSPRQHGWPWPAGAARDGNVAANLRCLSLYIRTARHVRGWMDGWIGVQMVWQTERPMLFMGPCVTCERQLVCVTNLGPKQNSTTLSLGAVNQIFSAYLCIAPKNQFVTVQEYTYCIYHKY